MKGGVGDRAGLGGRRRFGVGSRLEQLARPFVGSFLGLGELAEREHLADALPETRDDDVDLLAEVDVAAIVRARVLDTAVPVLPLLSRELDVHQSAVQQESGQSDGSSARMRSPSS